MSYNQQYLVAAQMGHQQVQVQTHQAELVQQQVITDKFAENWQIIPVKCLNFCLEWPVKIPTKIDDFRIVFRLYQDWSSLFWNDGFQMLE